MRRVGVMSFDGMGLYCSGAGSLVGLKYIHRKEESHPALPLWEILTLYSWSWCGAGALDGAFSHFNPGPFPIPGSQNIL